MNVPSSPFWWLSRIEKVFCIMATTSPIGVDVRESMCARSAKDRLDIMADAMVEESAAVADAPRSDIGPIVCSK